jgi:hypothetical protein
VTFVSSSIQQKPTQKTKKHVLGDYIEIAKTFWPSPHLVFHVAVFVLDV